MAIFFRILEIADDQGKGTGKYRYTSRSDEEEWTYGLCGHEHETVEEAAKCPDARTILDAEFRRDGASKRPLPRIVCLCGSTRFWREFQRASLSETMAGRIVLSIGAASGTDDEHFGNLPREEYDRIKAELDELHKRKIDLADEILVLNVEGYVGVSTESEIKYAKQHGKDVRWLWMPDGIDSSCEPPSDEMMIEIGRQVREVKNR